MEGFEKLVWEEAASEACKRRQTRVEGEPLSLHQSPSISRTCHLSLRYVPINSHTLGNIVWDALPVLYAVINSKVMQLFRNRHIFCGRCSGDGSTVAVQSHLPALKEPVPGHCSSSASPRGSFPPTSPTRVPPQNRLDSELAAIRRLQLMQR